MQLILQLITFSQYIKVIKLINKWATIIYKYLCILGTRILIYDPTIKYAITMQFISNTTITFNDIKKVITVY